MLSACLSHSALELKLTVCCSNAVVCVAWPLDRVRSLAHCCRGKGEDYPAVVWPPVLHLIWQTPVTVMKIGSAVIPLVDPFALSDHVPLPFTFLYTSYHLHFFWSCTTSSLFCSPSSFLPSNQTKLWTAEICHVQRVLRGWHILWFDLEVSEKLIVNSNEMRTTHMNCQDTNPANLSQVWFRFARLGRCRSCKSGLVLCRPSKPRSATRNEEHVHPHLRHFKTIQHHLRTFFVVTWDSEQIEICLAKRKNKIVEKTFPDGSDSRSTVRQKHRVQSQIMIEEWIFMNAIFEIIPEIIQ